MVRVVFFPLSSRGGFQKLAVDLEKHADEGYIPAACCHIPTSDGPGGLLYTLMQIDSPPVVIPTDDIPDTAIVADGGNGSADPSVVDPDPSI